MAGFWAVQAAQLHRVIQLQDRVKMMWKLPMKFMQMKSEQSGWEVRLQTKLTEQLRAAMATNEAKWQTDKGKGHATTSEGRGHANPLSPPNEFITTLEGWTDGVQHTSKLGSMRLDIPKFDGTDAQRWIFQIQEYFDYHQTPEPHRLQMAGFCLEGDASEWYRWMKRNRIVHGWHDFLENIEQRFGSSQYEDPLAELAKLIQTGMELLMARPDTVAATFKLAKAHETRHAEIIAETRMANRGNPQLQTPLGEHRWQPRITSIPQAPSSAAPPQNITLALLIKKYTATEIRERRDKGLCFHCDQKYSPGHRCRGPFLLLVGTDDADATEADVQEVEPDSSGGEVVTGDISMLNTLAGPGSPRSLRLMGKINKQSCLVLIDSGSTHNFIHPTFTEKLQLATTPIKPFKVYVGNGDTLTCQYVCRGVNIFMQGNSFTLDLNVLPIAGPDIVLGIQWLQGLERVAHDYSMNTMEFKNGTKKVVLTGETALQSHPISFTQLQAMVTHGEVQATYLLYQNSPTCSDTTPAPENLPKPFQNLLTEFSPIFEPPKKLPPTRPIDHKIHLLPNTKPVNVRPYRYPYFQNQSENQRLVGVSAEEADLLRRSKKKMKSGTHERDDEPVQMGEDGQDNSVPESQKNAEEQIGLASQPAKSPVISFRRALTGTREREESPEKQRNRETEIPAAVAKSTEVAVGTTAGTSLLSASGQDPRWKGAEETAPTKGDEASASSTDPTAETSKRPTWKAGEERAENLGCSRPLGDKYGSWMITQRKPQNYQIKGDPKRNYGRKNRYSKRKRRR
nr:Transposon Ty3-G Gag-Pol polyprotein [Ipomoea batatas]